MTTAPSTQKAAVPAGPPTLPRAAGLAWGVALAGNLLLLALATGPLGVEVLHPDPPGSDTLGAVTWVHVGLSTTVGTLLALTAAALAARSTPRPRAAFLAVACLGVVVSTAGPFSIAGASASSTAVLVAMHVITAAALLPSLARALPRVRTRR
jgi:uncharacterized membrane protein